MRAAHKRESAIIVIGLLLGGVNPGTPAYVGYLCIILPAKNLPPDTCQGFS